MADIAADPELAETGTAPVNGIRIWYATFGRGKPVLLLHGGLANSNYWGNQVPALAKGYRVVVMDSRGHGRVWRCSAGRQWWTRCSDAPTMS